MQQLTLDGNPIAVASRTTNNGDFVGSGSNDFWVGRRRDGQNFNIPADGGIGPREGDIVVAAGNNISLDHTLVGHADPAVKASNATNEDRVIVLSPVISAPDARRY